MRALKLLGAAAALAAATACASRAARVPAVTTPLHPEYVEPRIPPALAPNRVAANHERAWLLLQAGDLRNAEREISTVLRRQPDFYPTLTTAAYVALARRDGNEALARFDRALAARPDYVPALAGKGLALQAESRDTEALETYRQVVRLDPTLTDIARRVDVLTLRSLQVELASAREAAKVGNTAEALRAYRSAIEASPDSAFLYREVAAIERQRADFDAALRDLRRAAELDPGDASTFASIGEVLEARGDAEGALKAYDESLAIERDPRVEGKREGVRARLELARLPEQYRAIGSNPQITRGELAALIGVRLAALIDAAPARDVGVITDVRGNWAERWITPVARAGVLEPFPNHAFQPRTVVRRVDFAQAVARLLSFVAAANSTTAVAWQGARGSFSDLTSGHLAFPAASAAVASGVMTTGPDGAFQPTRPVSGEEAVAAIERLEALAGPLTRQASDRR